jgi:MFS family permease
MFVALGYPNFRLWFIGQMISLMGTWMQMTAQGYLVFQLTHSSAYLGYVAFASGLPTWFLTMYGGVVADRMSRRTLMILTQCAMMILALILAALVFSGLIRPWHIMGLAFLLGIANSFDAPARQSFLLEMVERKHLTNAIALNATMFHIGTAVGPAVAGFAYAALGPGWCFLLNGFSFVAVIAALSLMRLRPFEPPAGRGSAAAEMAEGLRYVATHSVIRAVIVLIGLVSLFAIGVFTLMPAWAVKILHGDARTLGFLQSSRGIGALIGALTLASLSHFRFKGRLLTLGTFALPIMLFAFAWMRELPLAVVVFIAVGSSQMLVMNLGNAIVQAQVPDALRGRVMGLYTLLFFGMMPLGGLLAGTLAHAIGEGEAVMLAAGGLFMTAIALRAFAPAVGRVQAE